MKDISSRRDRIRTEIELQAGFLGCGYEAVSRGFVARDVHITAGLLVLCLDAIGRERRRRMGVGTIVVSGPHHLDVGLSDGGLLGKLLTEEVVDKFQVTVEEPANDTQGKHIAALEHALVVHALVFKTLLDHLRDGASHHPVGIDPHLL